MIMMLSSSSATSLGGKKKMEVSGGSIACLQAEFFGFCDEL
jgi:hypothetical protein